MRKRNWREYNKKLVQRGSLTFLIDPKVMNTLAPKVQKKRKGRPLEFSDQLVLLLLTVKIHYKMNAGTPRLRMFAGPNGSGKSTFKSMIRKELLGIYVNPDDIEKEIKDFDFLDLAAYSVSTNKEEILSFFKKSTLLERADCLEDAHSLRFNIDIRSYPLHSEVRKKL